MTEDNEQISYEDYKNKKAGELYDALGCLVWILVLAAIIAIFKHL